MQNEQCKREYVESVKSVAEDRMQDKEGKREYRESAKSVALPEN